MWYNNLTKQQLNQICRLFQTPLNDPHKSGIYEEKELNKKVLSIIFALLAAVFYAINIPCSKFLLKQVTPTFMASFLYFGAALGIGIIYLLTGKKQKDNKLNKRDLPYTIGMIVLDIAAPIFLMLGISKGNSSTASLLGNFEIVATALIALVVFKEAISKWLWSAIAIITLSGALLSFNSFSELRFSAGSLYVILATLCWGLENNCTRKIASKSTYEIVLLKGVFSGLGSFIIAFIVGEHLPQIKYIALTLLLGSVAYGLSIFLYVKAQNTLGAAKTSAYYAVAPFVGAAISFIYLKEKLSVNTIIATVLMIAGTVFVIYDTLVFKHRHLHTHTIVHTHDGATHTHTVTHSHEHKHFMQNGKHTHTHTPDELEKYLENHSP